MITIEIPRITQGIPYILSNFPSGESYIKISPEDIKGHTAASIFFRYQGDSSLLHLLHATDALRRLGIIQVDLIIPYFPGARGDRVEEEQLGEALSAKVYAQLINAQDYNKVTIFDPHSNVVSALLDRVHVVTNKEFVHEVLQNLIHGEIAQNNLILVAPDAGSSKKVKKIAEAEGLLMVQAEKARDLQTGKLIPHSCLIATDGVELTNKWAVIVDDICSRGGTFTAIAKKLKALGVERVYLIVSHYEWTADEKVLAAAGITKVITTDSRQSKQTPMINTCTITKYVS